MNLNEIEEIIEKYEKKSLTNSEKELLNALLSLMFIYYKNIIEDLRASVNEINEMEEQIKENLKINKKSKKLKRGSKAGRSVF